MKVTCRLMKEMLMLTLALGVTVAATGLHAQTAQGTIEVKGLMGSATYSIAGGAAMPLEKRAAIPVGSVVKTAPGSAVDLSFSHRAGVVRLLQNSALSLDRFSVIGAGAPVDIQLHLSEGSLLGFENKLSKPSRYQIKVAHGIADVSGSKYRIDAQGYLVLLEGHALFVLVPPGGQPAPFELKGPAPVYFSPVQGVRTAPGELVREVALQTKGLLRK